MIYIYIYIRFRFSSVYFKNENKLMMVYQVSGDGERVAFAQFNDSGVEEVSAIIFWRIILILTTFMMVTILIFCYQSYQYPKYSNNLSQGGIAGVWVIPRVWCSNTSKETRRQILSISKGMKPLTNHIEN